jgi:glycosyl transferase family 2
VIAFGTHVSEPEPYEKWSRPGIERASEPDSQVLAYAAVNSLPRSLNILLDAAAAIDDLEALVLIHPQVEIVDDRFCDKLREALAEDVGVVGCVGATDVRTLAWWEGRVSCAPMTHRYEEAGGGEIRAFDWARPEAPLGDVEVVDGLLIALSPWVVRNLRFDESLRLGHGFDYDICRQVREAGRRVVTADLRVVYHHALELVGELHVWAEAHMQVAEKWEDDGGDPNGAEWERRARRAEAEREAARAVARGHVLEWDAQILTLERELEEATGTLAWRITEPLRWLNQRRRERAQRR